MQHYCSNDGGIPRYDVNGDPDFLKDRVTSVLNVSRLREQTTLLANKHKELIRNYTDRLYTFEDLNP